MRHIHDRYDIHVARTVIFIVHVLARLLFSISASADGANHEGDGEASGNTSTSVCGRACINPDQHVTAACGSDYCAGRLTPFQPTDAATLEKLRKKQGD